MKRLPFAALILTSFLAGCATKVTAVPQTGGDKTGSQPDSITLFKANQYLSVGIDYYRKQQYEDAIKNFQKSLEFIPDYYPTMVAWAVTCQDMGDLECSKGLYTKLYALYPDSLTGYLGLGGIYLIMASSIDPTYLDSAEVVYNKGLERFPEESSIYHALAEVYKRRGGTQAADSLYKAGISKNPENLALRNSYVDFLIDQKRYQEAMEQEQYIVGAKPENPFAREKLGDIYMALEKYQKAAESYRAALDLRPESIDLRIKLGNALMNTGKYPEAEKSLKEAIELDSTRITPRIYLGLTYLNWGRDGSAESTFKAILSMDSNSAPALYYLGVIYARRAGKAVNQTTKEAWQAGCSNARTATNYLQKAVSADSSYGGRVNEQIQYVEKVRGELKKKLFLLGISEC